MRARAESHNSIKTARHQTTQFEHRLAYLACTHARIRQRVATRKGKDEKPLVEAGDWQVCVAFAFARSSPVLR
jgi:hypothetical protein